MLFRSTTYLREQLELRRRDWTSVVFVSVRRSLADCMVGVLGHLGLTDYRALANKDYAGFFAEDRQHWLVVQMESLYRMGQSFRRASRALVTMNDVATKQSERSLRENNHFLFVVGVGTHNWWEIKR